MFRVRNDVTLFVLKDQLNQINCPLNHKNTGRMESVEYQRPSINSVGRVQLSHMKLKNDDDARTMFSIFGPYNTKGMIELDTLLVKSFEYIQKSLI
ncbi:hypothetical protein MTR_4g091120 [Medicago truncatula]|uniref:Uncharacterized protein n=1 Tax=Medicago truncatula TaxID=3880 RepID=G7JRU3_MEDTR|nr:hypothetical protein MTR_4g091120 [Medicago truncatula]